MNARKAVLDLLLKMDKGGYSPLVLDNAFKKSGFSDSDKGFVTACFYGVLERRLTLDYVMSKFAKAKPDALIRAILRMALYELLYMESGNHAAVNEAVELAPKRARGYVNAVLRSFLRADRDSVLAECGLSVEYSCPEWLVRKWQSEYGEEDTLQILRTSLGKPPQYDRDGYVQDKSSYEACVLLNPQAGDTVLDLCSAPGGKSFTIAKMMNNQGKVIACDINERKLALVGKGAERLGLFIISTRMNDAKVFNDELPMADKVVCDVPCSGLGVIRRKPEIKYKPATEFDGLPQIQSAILNTSAVYVKSGGVLMYSTCTLSRAENDGVVDAFIAERKDFNLMEKRTTIPSEDGGDGFFAAIMRKA
ncbi:MAG: class I SAM-dependent methyltransferase [Oscillospiraceae bacterium]|nr:class I SAM-dependent methyltransferase [Oscillospiraceae bacterium]